MNETQLLMTNIVKEILSAVGEYLIEPKNHDNGGFQPDFIVNYDKIEYVVEIKSSLFGGQRYERIKQQLNNYIQADKNVLLIVFDTVKQRIKSELQEIYNILVWDINDLYFICSTNKNLSLNTLDSFLYKLSNDYQNSYAYNQTLALYKEQYKEQKETLNKDKRNTFIQMVVLESLTFIALVLHYIGCCNPELGFLKLDYLKLYTLCLISVIALVFDILLFVLGINIDKVLELIAKGVGKGR